MAISAKLIKGERCYMLYELRGGFETAFIDGSVVSNESSRPQFVSNNSKRGTKVLSSIEDELKYLRILL